MTPYERQRFHENLQTAQYAVHSARVYAREGRTGAAMDCLRIAGYHRRIAMGFLPKKA